MDINKLKQDPEKIQELIALLGSLLTESGEEEKKPQTKTTRRKRTAKKQTTSKKSEKNKIEETTNKFLDMPEMHMHKEDNAIDAKLQKFAPTPRTRSHASTVSVRCRVCGKQEEINTSLLFEGANRYKCNKCSTQSAG